MSKLTESDFLSRQADDAKAAITATAHSAMKDAGQVVDPRLWAQSYPWATLAGAAVSGFMAAVAVVPSKEQQALRRLAEFERLSGVHAAHVEAGSNAAASGESDKKGSGKGWIGTILREILNLARPALSSFLAAQMAQHDHNGHDPVSQTNPS